MGKNRSKLYIAIFAASFLLGLFVKLSYREFILANNINDFGFADVAPNLFFTIGFSALFLAFGGDAYSIIAVVAALIFYEVDQAFNLVKFFWSPGTFDVKDILATIMGGFVMFFIMNRVKSK